MLYLAKLLLTYACLAVLFLNIFKISFEEIANHENLVNLEGYVFCFFKIFQELRKSWKISKLKRQCF